MKKSVGIIIAVAVIIIGGGALLVGTRHSSSSDNASTATSTPPAAHNDGDGDNDTTAGTKTPSPSTDSSNSTSNAVTIDNFMFSPMATTVKKGTTVTWTNKDSVAHTVKETDGQTGPNSGSLGNGKSYSFTFDTAGTFKYDCSIHPNMTATVTVTD